SPPPAPTAPEPAPAVPTPDVLAQNSLPRLAHAKLFWRAAVVSLVLAATNPGTVGRQLWETSPTMRCLMQMLVCTDFRFPPPGAAAASEDVQLQQLTAGTGAGTSASIETDGRGGSNNENGHRRAVRSSRRGDSDAFAFMPQLQSANNGNRRSGSPVRRADGRESRPGGGRGGSEGQAGRIGVA
ncbi:unnamed protein product, partial [Sphacelaria rigidula]